MRRDENIWNYWNRSKITGLTGAEGYSQVNQEELAGDNRTNWRRNWNVISGKQNK